MPHLKQVGGTPASVCLVGIWAWILGFLETALEYSSRMLRDDGNGPCPCLPVRQPPVAGEHSKCGRYDRGTGFLVLFQLNSFTFE